MTDTPTTSTPAPAAAPVVPTPADSSSSDAPIEAFAAELLGTSTANLTGEPAADASPTPAPGETPVARIELPGLDQIRETAQQRAQERAERAAASAPIEQLRADIMARLDAVPTGPSVPVGKLKDPATALAALREAGVDIGALVQAGARAQLQADPADKLGALIDAKLAPLLEQLQPKTPEAPKPTGPTPEVREQLASNFVQYVAGGAELYPEFARMVRVSPKAAAALALEYVDGLAEMGHDTSGIPDTEIARAIEASFADPQPADPHQTAEGGTSPGTPTTAEGSSAQRPIPGSLTNGHAADAQRSPPKGKKAEIDDLVAFARTLGVGS